MEVRTPMPSDTDLPKPCDVRMDYLTGVVFDVTPNRPAETAELDMEEQAIRMMVPDKHMRKSRILEMKRLRLGAFIGGFYDIKLTEHQTKFEDKDGKVAERVRRMRNGNQHGAPRHPRMSKAFHHPTRAEARRCRRLSPSEGANKRKGLDLLESIATLQQERATSWASHWAKECFYDFEIAGTIKPCGTGEESTRSELEISDYKKAELKRIGAVSFGQLVPAM